MVVSATEGDDIVVLSGFGTAGGPLREFIHIELDITQTHTEPSACIATE